MLGFPALRSGSGEHQAQGLFQLLRRWNLEGWIIGMLFDTTDTNTGRFNAACVRVEQKLGKWLLHIACRHHIME